MTSSHLFKDILELMIIVAFTLKLFDIEKL